MFIQDGDLRQISKDAKIPLDNIAAVKLSMTPPSLGLSPKANTFNLVEENLNSDPVKDSISKESYAKVVERVEYKLFSYPIKLINHIIKSIPKRRSQIKDPTFEILIMFLLNFYLNLTIRAKHYQFKKTKIINSILKIQQLF